MLLLRVWVAGVPELISALVWAWTRHAALLPVHVGRAGGGRLLLAFAADELGDELVRVLPESVAWNGDLACTTHFTSYERFLWLRKADRAVLNNWFASAGIRALLLPEGQPLDSLSSLLQLPSCAVAPRLASSGVEIETLLERVSERLGEDPMGEDQLLVDLLSALLGPDSESTEVQ